MDVVKTLKPGKNGTKRLVERHGDSLIAVRYRLDRKQRISYTTVELIVEQRAATPSRPDSLPSQPEPQISALRILRHESGRQRLVKAAGGKWDSANRVWLIDYDEAIRLGLKERITTA